MLARWFYVSTSRLPEDAGDDLVKDIVDVAVPRNRTLQVTGALLFTGRQFAQYLEGSREAIDVLRHSIMDDLRHENVTTLAEGDYPERRFVTWSLAYIDPAHFDAADVDALIDGAREGDSGSYRTLVQLLSERAMSGRS